MDERPTKIMKLSTKQLEILNSFLDNNSDITQFPWVLDTCNEREITVKDFTGNVVLYEDLTMPDEFPSGRAERIILDAHTRAKTLVELSQILAGNVYRVLEG